MNKKVKLEDLEGVVSDEQAAQLNEEVNNNEEATTSEETQKDPIVLLEDELAKEKDKFLRLFAEFENYKKRTAKERMDLFKTAGQEVMLAMLPILDDFDRALKELSKSQDTEMFKGVELIHIKCKEALKSKGLEEIKTKPGEAFDAEVHDAITQIPAPNKKMKGKIVDVIEKGYQLGDRIIRHPKVVVGN